jgi:hypothetical protein
MIRAQPWSPVHPIVLAVAAGLAAGTAACGEAIFVPGDLPGIMRVVAGIPESPGATVDPRATAI